MKDKVVLGGYIKISFLDIQIFHRNINSKAEGGNLNGDFFVAEW